jgi:hypothetical protein
VGPHASAWVALLVADAGAAQELSDCKTIIWNGPMGVFEFEKFAKGTNDVATTLAECTAKVRADSLSADMLLWPVSSQTHFVSERTQGVGANHGCCLLRARKSCPVPFLKTIRRSILDVLYGEVTSACAAGRHHHHRRR